MSPYQRLDPLALAEHLDIPIEPLSHLPQLVRSDGITEAVAVLGSPESSCVSAITVFRGNRRIVVHNDAHSDERQSSNLSHELAHGLLLHPPAPPLDGRGCRDWKADVEDEAIFLAGALLVPAKAAWVITKRRVSFVDAAEQYGCSVEMVRWRVNVTGALRLLAS